MPTFLTFIDIFIHFSQNKSPTILGYYLIATLFPIDKIIGKIYPIFGAILLLSAVGIFGGIFIKGYELNNLDFSNGFMGLFNMYPYWEGVSGATAVVGEVARDLLGPIGGIIAILGVIVLPITSGNTALRSCRLMVADYLHYDQKSSKNRIILTLCIFIPVIAILIYAKLNAEGFNILWRYFAWANQTIAVFAFAAITVYLRAKKGAPKFAYLISLLPGSFYLFIISSFIMSQKIGFGLNMTISYIIAAVITLLYFVGLIMYGNSYAKKHEEE